jgi:carboxypeptidase T
VKRVCLDEGMKLHFVILCSLALLFKSTAFALDSGAQRTYAEVVSSLNTLATNYSSNVKTFILGDSDSGQKIVGVQIGSGPVHNLVVGTHHGNEYGATEVALAFATTLAAQPIVGQTVYVIPVLNIGGYTTRTRTEDDTHHKTFDPNRNYPSPCGTEGPFTLMDTKALDQFISDKGIVASATLHTFSPAVTYPWGFSTHDLTTGYDTIFKGLVTQATLDSHYPAGNTTDLIYPANGSFEDYAFLQYGIWSILFELGGTHTPNATQTAELIRVNVPGLRRMLESAPTTRADHHAFTGTCDTSRAMKARDLHNE